VEAADSGQQVAGSNNAFLTRPLAHVLRSLRPELSPYW